jgi:hypothetical protein
VFFLAKCMVRDRRIDDVNSTYLDVSKVCYRIGKKCPGKMEKVYATIIPIGLLRDLK